MKEEPHSKWITGHTIRIQKPVNTPNSKWPIDLDSIRRGDYMTMDSLRPVLRLDPIAQYTAWQFGLMQLAKDIERAMRLRGDPVVVSCKGRGIWVLSARDAVKYNARNYRSSIRRLYRTHRRDLEINPEELPEAEQAVLSRNIQVGGLVVRAVRTANRQRSKLTWHKSRKKE